MSASQFLGAETTTEGTSFTLGDHLRGAFGGVFGGGIAAATLLAARSAAPDRRPTSLHCAFLRTLAPGTHPAAVDVISEGKTLTTVGVRLAGADGAPAAIATVVLAAPAALHAFDATPMKCPALDAFEDGWELPVPKGLDAPLMNTLPLRITGMPRGGFAHAVRAPWTEAVDVEEGAAIMGDYCAGLSVGAAVGPEGTKIPVPNPDLSLRFVGGHWDALLVGVGRLAAIDGGTAATNVEVWTGPDDRWVAGDPRVRLLAVGVSSAVMLRR